MNGIKLLSFLLFVSVFSYSQSDSMLIKGANSSVLKRFGKNALLQNDPESSIAFFTAYLKNNPNDAQAKEYLAKGYMQVRDYDKAEHAFLAAYKTNKLKVPEALYYCALMQKSNEKYDSAKINFQKFKKEYKGSNKELKKIASKETVFCDSVQNVLKHENKIVIQRLDNSINKVNTEGAPFNLDENTLLFTSLRTDSKEYIIDDDSSLNIKRKLYYATRDSGEWKFKGEFGNNLNGNEFNISNAALSPDRKRLYFTRCKLNYREEMICAIYVTEKINNVWTDPVKLPKTINNNKYTSTMPAVSRDPVKGNDVLFFVSNRPNGKGKLDIWYSVYDKKNKTFKEPRNAGSKINSTRNEISPFIDVETRNLYFSSDGFGGLGGYDIFKATGDGKKWVIVENIGQPLNTGADDIYYTISTNRQEGFFVSNRKGGNSFKNATCCDDIYYYKQLQYIKLNVKGTVHDAVDPTTTISNANIELYIINKVTNEKLLVKTIQTDSLGNYSTNVEANQDYYIVVKKADYLGTSVDVTTKQITDSKDITSDMVILKRPKGVIHIPNIQYEFDRSNLLEASKISLDTTVLKLMQLNPELVVEIQSHTDNKGSDAYNKKLSQKRAESVVNYLISKGIPNNHIKAMGYGESNPIAPNNNPDGTDSPDGRAKNRRTDFKIIGVIDAEIINEAEIR